MLCGTSFVLTDENIVEDNWDAMYDRYTLAIKG